MHLTRYEKCFNRKLNLMLGCKLAVFVQAVCNMASDELCLKEGKVFAQEQKEIGKLNVERERLKAEFVKMLRRFNCGRRS